MSDFVARKVKSKSFMPKIEWARRNSVSTRLILGIIGFSSFIAIFTTAVQVFLDYQRDVDKIHNDLAYMESVSLPPIAKSMWELSEQSIVLQLDSLISHPGINHVAIQVDGKVTWSAGTVPAGDVIMSEHSLEYSQGSTKYKLGQIRITAGLTEIYQKVLRQTAVILGSNFLKTLVVAVFMYVLVYFLITRHLASLAVYAKKMSPDRLTASFEFQGKTGVADSPDEFDDIALAINQMRENLKSSYDNLTISNDKLQDLYDNAPDMYCSVDARTTQVAQCNNTLADKLGLSKDEIIGRPIFDFYHPDSRDTARSTFQKFIETGQENHSDMQVITSDGDRVDVDLRVSAVRNEAGEIVQSRSVWRDITRRKQAERARHESDERLRNAVESMQEGFALFDADDNLIAINSEFARFNTSAKEILERGGTFEEMFTANVNSGRIPAAVGCEEDFIRERMRQHRNPEGPIIRELENGAWFMVRESRTPDGGTAVSIGNISELKQAEEDRRLALVKAEEANQAKSEFLASMSHELRTPLNAILGFADLLSHEVLGPLGVKKYGEYAEDIHSSGEHLLSLVNDLLDLSTIEAGKQKLHKQDLEIGEIVSECARTLTSKAEESGIELIQTVPGNLATINADRRAIKQILINLLTNAIKFTPIGGKVEVSAKRHDGEVAFMIADTGRGISEEDLPTITELFTKARDDPYKVTDGWGLGLAITKALIDLHDGRLEIDSRLGEGTTIEVTLPSID